ncbi:hypothetical protein J6590_000270 [Homalodisca vitripennis]|nr:hypothetical protein J6590_000270 [Homalodisca vitripennis]
MTGLADGHNLCYLAAWRESASAPIQCLGYLRPARLRNPDFDNCSSSIETHTCARLTLPLDDSVDGHGQGCILVQITRTHNALLLPPLLDINIVMKYRVFIVRCPRAVLPRKSSALCALKETGAAAAFGILDLNMSSLCPDHLRVLSVIRTDSFILHTAKRILDGFYSLKFGSLSKAQEKIALVKCHAGTLCKQSCRKGTRAIHVWPEAGTSAGSVPCGLIELAVIRRCHRLDSWNLESGSVLRDSKKVGDEEAQKGTYTVTSETSRLPRNWNRREIWDRVPFFQPCVRYYDVPRRSKTDQYELRVQSSYVYALPFRSRDSYIVRDAEKLAMRMNHRGACACDNDTGDGAGVLTAIPHSYYAHELREQHSIDLPPFRQYATGIFYLDKIHHADCEAQFTKIAEECNLKVLYWRTVPTNSAGIGEVARSGEPFMRQVFVVPASPLQEDELQKQVSESYFLYISYWDHL